MSDDPLLYYTPYVDPGKKLFIIVGTCISVPVRRLLALHETFGKEYSIVVYNSNRNNNIIEDLNIDQNLLSKASVVAFHTPESSDWGNEDGYRKLIASLPACAERISFPYPSFVPLWPFHTHEPRNNYDNLPLNHFTFGKGLYPYGDSFVHGLMRKSVSPEKIHEQYMSLDIAKVVDLDALLTTTLKILHKRDESLTIKVASFVEENFRIKSLFNSVNHISNNTVLYIVNSILKLLGHSEYRPQYLEHLLEFVRPQVPIHPSIIRHFGLRFADESTTYVHFGHKYTFEQYLYSYIHFL